MYGFQRVIALKRLGRDTARANIYEDATWLELQEQSISNNERHLDLGDLEKALYVKALQEKGVTVPRLCELFGVNKSAIYNYLTVADLDDAPRECLHQRLITLNHAVELARCGDVSKRLETLFRVLSWKLSVRDLKQWMAGDGSLTLWLPLGGWIGLCPKLMTMVKIARAESAEEMAKRGLGPGAIQQQLAHQHDSCEGCEYFGGLYEDEWQVECSYDVSQSTPGLRKLMEIARTEYQPKGHIGERPTDLDTYRRERWGRLVRNRAANEVEKARVPLDVISKEGVLDGRHRLKAAQEVGLSVVPVQMLQF